MKKIKTRILSFLTAAACLTGSVGMLTANALDLGFCYEAARNIIIETDTFTYADGVLTTDLVDADFMVIGVSPSNDPANPGYWCDVVNIGADGRFWDLCYFRNAISPNADGTPVQIGDFLSCEEYEILETYPGQVLSSPEVIDLGNGADLLGEEFERVIRLQTVEAMADLADLNGQERAYEMAEKMGVIDYFGDLNLDDAVDILDCITINKQLLGSDQLLDYVRIFGDVNSDGVLDATDSLLILKEVVGLTEHFEEV